MSRRSGLFFSVQSRKFSSCENHLPGRSINGTGWIKKSYGVKALKYGVGVSVWFLLLFSLVLLKVMMGAL